MHKTVAVIAAIAAFSLAGCKSKQDQLTELNAQFDTLNAQYQKDCITAPTEVIQRTQAACKAERDRMNPLGKRIIELQNDAAAAKR